MACHVLFLPFRWRAFCATRWRAKWRNANARIVPSPSSAPLFFLPPPLFLLCSSYCFRINPAWFTYRFRILSVLFPLLEARMIEQRKKEEKRKSEGRYGNNTGLIRDRYETEWLPSEEEGEYSNFFIMIDRYYILHFVALPRMVSHGRIAGTPAAIT